MTGAPARSAAPGILVVAVDRLPAWMLPAYGATWVAMPRLTALAARGVVLDRMIATTDDPRASLADLLGGAGQPPPVVAAAADRGWRTVIVSDDGVMRLPGATIVHVPAAPRSLPARDADETSLARLCAAARGEVAGGSRLVVLHVTSLGVCWDAPAEFREAYVDADDPPPPPGADVPDFDVAADADPDLLVGIRQAFAGQLTLLDACLGDLFDAAAAAGWVVIVAGLRGLALGLHGRVGPDGAVPWGEVVHLPAIAVGPGWLAAQRFGGLVVPADVGATLVEVLGGRAAVLEPSDPRRGASLGERFASWAGRDRDRAVAVTRDGTAVVTPAWHCVAAGDRVSLFAKPDDFFELCDVADRSPEVAEELGRLASGAVEAAWREPLSRAALTGE